MIQGYLGFELAGVSRSGIIISGGRSSRLGQDKGLMRLGGKPLVCWVIERLQGVVDDVVVVVGSEAMVPLYSEVVPAGVRVVADCYPQDSPLIGLITGLREVSGEYAVVCACDMPFIDPNVIEFLFDVSRSLNGVLLVKPNGWIEPIPSVYHVANCLSYAEALRESGEMRIRKILVNMQNTVKYPIENLRHIDPDLRSFIDLDTLDSVEEAQRMLRKSPR